MDGKTAGHRRKGSDAIGWNQPIREQIIDTDLGWVEYSHYLPSISLYILRSFNPDCK